jgi:peptidyl-prolyl cis-trans isomerase B (cyclophilin B)
VAGKKRERELARQRYQRRLARDRQQRQRRRRTNAIAGAAVAVLAVAGAASYAGVALSGGNGSAAVASNTSATPRPGATCTYRPANGPHVKAVGRPPANVTDPRRRTATIATNHGAITATLSGKQAPCTVNSLAFLASQHYFDHSPCHRLTTKGIFVLQCGDPSGTGSGGPGYKFGDENLGAFGGTPHSDKPVTYPAGTLAMANSGRGTNGSQFFLVYKDSKLAPKYTPFGRVTAGLRAIKKIAKKGVIGGDADGKPAEKVSIKSLTVTDAAPPHK